MTRLIRQCRECRAFTRGGNLCNRCRDGYRPSSAERYGPNWSTTRKRILDRDGWVCAICGQSANTVDHIVPRSQGGSHDDSNLRAMCGYHNSARGGAMTGG